MRHPNRREFLAVSGTFLLAACGNDSKGSSSTPATSGGVKTAADGYTVAQRFPQDVLVPGLVRLPISLADKQTLLPDGPDVLNGVIYDTVTAKPVASALSAKKRRASAAYVYWDFHAQLDKPGTYALVVDGGTPEGGAIQINDPSLVPIPLIGQPLPPFDTPTTDNHRGVEPICSRLTGGPCPFHDITLTEALALGKPVVYMIGTPAHCQFGICGPALESLIKAATSLSDRVTFVHADVFTDDTATVATPAVDAYHLSYEPVLFLADKSGKIVNRLDAAWDQTELDEVLAALVS